MPAGSFSIRSKVVASVLLACGTFLLASYVLASGPLKNVLRELLGREQERNARRLADELARVDSSLAAAPREASRAAEILGRRVTVVAVNGVVVADTAAPAERLANHADREELRAAAETGLGKAVRASATTGKTYLYVAVPIESGGRRLGFVRVATLLDDVDALAAEVASKLLGAALLATAIAIPFGAIGAHLATRKLGAMARVADEIGQGELGRRIEVPGDDEVGRLGRAVNLLAERLEEKLVRLTRDRGLLLAVLDAIGEGLAFVDDRGTFLAVNGSFRRLLGPGVTAEGHRVKDVFQDPAPFEDAIRRALETGRPSRGEAPLGDPVRDVGFRVVPTAVASAGTVALVITDDLSRSPRVEALHVAAAGLLARSLGATSSPLPREAHLCLELARAAGLLDEPAPPAEVVPVAELARAANAETAPPVYLVRSRALTGLRLLGMALGLREDEPLPSAIEVAPTRVALAIEPPKGKTGAWSRSAEELGAAIRELARRLALAHLEAAGAQVEEPSATKIVVGMPRA